MEYIDTFQYDKTTTRLYLHAGTEITHVSLYDQKRDGVRALFFDGGERDVCIATAVFVENAPLRYSIGNYALDLYEAGQKGALYKGFLDDVSSLDGEAVCMANGSWDKHYTKRQIIEIFLNSIVRTLRHPTVAKINGMDPQAEMVMYAELGYATDPGQLSMNKETFSSFDGDEKTTILVVNGMAGVIGDKNPKSLVSACNGRLLRYFLETGELALLGPIPSPAGLLEEYIKALCQREKGISARQVEFPELYDPTQSIYDAFDRFASGRQVKEVKITVRIDAEEELRICLKADDVAFFLEDLPIEVEGKVYHGAFEAVMSSLRVINDEKHDDELLALDDFYVQVLSHGNAMDVIGDRSFKQIYRVRPEIIFEQLRVAKKRADLLRKKRACPRCGGDTVKAASFCHFCGQRLLPQVKFCIMCGGQVDEGCNFCMRCGAAVYRPKGI